MTEDPSNDNPSDLQLFYHFLGQRLESGEPTLSVEEAVAAFQEYQRDAEKLEESAQPLEDDRTEGRS